MNKKLISLFTLTMILFCIITGCAKKAVTEDIFTNWVENSKPITALKEYVKTVTDEKSKNFIPKEDRLAVFDLDGTLYCETFPIYGEWILYSDYVLNTPSYKAPKDILSVAQELSQIKKASDIPGHMEQTHIHAHAKAFAGMTIENYIDVVNAFKKTKAEGPRMSTPALRICSRKRPVLCFLTYLLLSRFSCNS
jgi:hypothetical protein